MATTSSVVSVSTFKATVTSVSPPFKWLNVADRVVQYKKVVSRRWGLCRLPKKKPVGKKRDIYRLIMVNWMFYTRVYRDEKQRHIVAAGILFSYVTGCRLVSLFDTRVKIEDNLRIVERQENAFDGNEGMMVNGLENDMILDSDDKPYHGRFGKRKPDLSKSRPRRGREEVNENMENNTDSDTDYSVFSDAERDTEKDTDYSIFSEADDPNRFSDGFSVTDDKIT